MDNNLPLGRREIIAARLDGGNAVVANDLAAEFDISEDAIRRDLRALAAEGRCRRVYGGALPLSAASTPIGQRVGENEDRKRALAVAAVDLIRPGELLFLDNGSTNLALVPMLPVGSDISVATNSIGIAAAVQARGDIPLIMVGGMVDPTVGGCIDATAIRAIQQLNIDRTFLGACAVSSSEGIGAFDADDAAFKRAVMAASRQSVIMATSEKLETRAHYRIAGLDQVTNLVLEHDAIAITPTLVSEAGRKIVIAASCD